MLHAPGPESNRCARMPTAFGLVVLAHCLDYCRIGVDSNVLATNRQSQSKCSFYYARHRLVGSLSPSWWRLPFSILLAELECYLSCRKKGFIKSRASLD